MNAANEADELRALGKMLELGFLYRGLKPVNWCFDCGSALAEAEVEYADKEDLAVDVGFPAAEPEKLAKAFGLSALPLGSCYAVIWTTTPGGCGPDHCIATTKGKCTEAKSFG